MNEPLAFFITWTVYGTFLQGDMRGWRKWGHGRQSPQPLLSQWRSTHLKHAVILLQADHRVVVTQEIRRLCEYRNWKLWAVNVRSNHVHAVITAVNTNGARVRDQLKANCTRVLRENWSEFKDRPVWSEGGDWKTLNKEDDLEQMIIYVSEAQDRKGLDDRTTGTGR